MVCLSLSTSLNVPPKMFFAPVCVPNWLQANEKDRLGQTVSCVSKHALKIMHNQAVGFVMNDPFVIKMF